jgi:hypothetical protein
LRDDAIVPLICPTCQNVFAGFAQSIHASDRHATLHGVVFDILGSVWIQDSHPGLIVIQAWNGPIRFD